eukprot:CAMPEP_0116892416 /NCGR_PEP_ID=MMETSP0467-20121206/2645_1 /TAXON_ID=283647 /ORGANISM="Mesodinium pulex, Strain SPMC105" /LENGTH=50 /DNA_ID=CAMNT_0004561535 /DNA_START=323 /DNA_END=475 /DNA_ORIENTATION=+
MILVESASLRKTRPSNWLLGVTSLTEERSVRTRPLYELLTATGKERDEEA